LRELHNSNKPSISSKDL